MASTPQELIARINSNREVTLKEIANADFADLKVLNVSNSNIINGAIFGAIIQKALNLTEINISSCHGVTNVDLSDLISLDNLKTLNVAYSNISGLALSTIIQKASKLKEVSIFGISHNLTQIDLIKINRLMMNSTNGLEIKYCPPNRLHSFSAQNSAEKITQTTLDEHFIKLFMTCINDNTKYQPMHNMLSRTNLPGELVAKSFEFLNGNIISSEIDTLKYLFPEKQQIIDEFTKSTEFKQMTGVYNDYCNQASAAARSDASKLKPLLIAYKQFKQFQQFQNMLRCAYLTDYTLIDPKDNPYQITLRSPSIKD